MVSRDQTHNAACYAEHMVRSRFLLFRSRSWTPYRTGVGGACVGLSLFAAASFAQAPDEEMVPRALPTVSAGEAAPRPSAAKKTSCPNPEKAPGYLTINTQPWTRVLVDGKSVGSTPLFRHLLNPGQHVLRLVNEGEGIDLTEELEVEGSKTVKMNLFLDWDRPVGRLELVDDVGKGALENDCLAALQFPAFVSVRTNPWSRIYVDGKSVGTTPLFKHRIRPGDHVMRLVREGSKDNLISRFHARKGETVKIDLNHHQSGGQPALPKPAASP